MKHEGELLLYLVNGAISISISDSHIFVLYNACIRDNICPYLLLLKFRSRNNSAGSQELFSNYKPCRKIITSVKSEKLFCILIFNHFSNVCNPMDNYLQDLLVMFVPMSIYYCFFWEARALINQRK